MPVKDIASDLEVLKNTAVSVAADGQETGESVDMADFGEGGMVVADVTSYTDGAHALTVQESADDGDSDPWTDVPAEKLIINGTNIASNETSEGDALVKVGFFATKRYIRPAVDSSDVTTGAEIALSVIRKGEILPVAVEVPVP